ncbi:MAG: TatD family hydrolase [Bacteroidota bacterium]|nr:TatD family hydrolase [Bacteroidota bacterium]
MEFVDTHTHLYMSEFDDDREVVFQDAIDNGVTRLLMPNVDASTIKPLLQFVKQHPAHCFPMMGLHPTSVNENYQEELNLIKKTLDKGKFVAIGEVGLDLYWDKTFLKGQVDAFSEQVGWSVDTGLPLMIHVRKAYDETLAVLSKYKGHQFGGVFHCFSGNIQQARKVIELGFKLGIGGVVTYKNSSLQKIVEEIPLNCLVLETDSPYLTPVPFRGQRNQSAYIPYIAQKIAELKSTTIAEVAEITTQNAKLLFNL